MYDKERAKETVRLVAENMLLARGAKKVIYRPCKKNDAVTKKILGEIYVDLGKIYPNAADGDFAYVATKLCVPYPSAVTICCRDAAEAAIDGNAIEFDENGRANIQVRDGSLLRFKCVAEAGKFGVGYALSTVYYPGMWACDYLYWIRSTVPTEEYSVEDGVAISELNGEEYILPEPTVRREKVDINELFAEGEYAFALTYALEDTTYSGSGEAFADGVAYDGGVIKKGTEVLVRIKKSDDRCFMPGDDGCFGIPFMETKRKNSGRWLIIGGFENGALPAVQFKSLYNGKFWRLEDGSYLRAYLDTSFYGQWFYALMVGQYGILKASGIVGDGLRQYFIDGMKILADYFEYARYDAQIFGAPTFLQRSIRLADLDSIGTMGMNLCDLYDMMPNENILRVIDKLRLAMTDIPKFPDGTFHRENTMWADDTFMSLPFLVRLAKIKNDDSLFDECVRQIKGFYERLYIPEENLFSHIYFLDDERANRVPWGRGNGWVFVTISEVLMRIPDTNAGKTWILQLFRSFADGIKKVQGENGLWHQVLNMPSSYEETSCSAMFALGMLRGVENGWLEDEYRDCIDKALNGLEQNSIDVNGNITGVCRGSECSYDRNYYAKLATVVNDDHGTGIILALFSEYAKSKL